VTVSHSPGKAVGLLELLSPSPGQPDWAPISLLGTLLDSRLLFDEPGLAAGQLEPLFEAWWPDRSLAETLAPLLQEGLLTRGPGQRYSVSPAAVEPLAGALDNILTSQALSLPTGTVRLGDLLAAFSDYCLQELSGPTPAGPLPSAWGGAAYLSGGRTHLLLFRPAPLRLDAHPELFSMLVCQLPGDGIQAITGQFVEKPSLRQRLALYDLDRGEKMNLTRSDLFIYFERFLRWVHKLRIVPSPELTQSLVDSGILVLEKS